MPANAMRPTTLADRPILAGTPAIGLATGEGSPTRVAPDNAATKPEAGRFFLDRRPIP